MSTDALIARWDDQQAAYIAEREGRFTALIDALALACGPRPVVVDLGCGPGSLAERVLTRLPGARVIGIDHDPALLQLAADRLARFGDRVRVCDADLLADDWLDDLDRVESGPIHAMVSTTALHWLGPADLVTLYGRIHDRLAAGGILLNGDHFRFDARASRIRDWSARHDADTQEHAFAAGVDDWDTWWSRLAATDGFGAALAERLRRFAARPAPPPSTVEFQLAALRQAGFTESGTVWQLFDDYVVYGVTAGDDPTR